MPIAVYLFRIGPRPIALGSRPIPIGFFTSCKSLFTFSRLDLQHPTETWILDRTAKSFKGAKGMQVQSVLDSLAALGLIVTFGDANAREWRAGA
jgi:hypothetical protein